MTGLLWGFFVCLFWLLTSTLAFQTQRSHPFSLHKTEFPAEGTEGTGKTKNRTKEGLLLTVILSLAWPRADASLGRDGHQRLPDGFLPTLPYIPSHARCCQSWVVVEATVVLPDVVHHAARDDLKAVWVATLRQSAKVLRWLHLQDLRQGDLLWNKKESLNPGCCG